ncbi:MAG: sensor histidine kinase [Desulfobacca sp.]|uniref:sensor histidine kinase n=1 Tax=Desulfobacca sp. TaxID=2067990 RepID=UPI004049EB4B
MSAFSPEQNPSQDSSSEGRRRRREKILIGIIILLVVTITLVEVRLVRQRGESITDSLLAFGLVNLNTILLLFLTFLIFRNVVKLILERRQKIFGSRLRIRLVLTFVFLSLLPTLLMSFVAFEFISGRTEHQLNAQVEKSLTNAVVLVQSYFRGIERKVVVCGQLLSRLLQEQNLLDKGGAALQEFLQERREAYALENLEIFTPEGNRLAGAVHEAGRIGVADAALFSRLRQLPPGAVARQPEADGEMLRGIFPIPGPEVSPTPQAFLLVSQLLPKPVLQQMADVRAGMTELRRLQYILRPVRVSRYVALGAVTLLVLMSAVWLGMYMAREITTPIRQLAEGTLKVADGDYSIHIDQEGRDEIGFLVQSFNKMTQDLQLSRRQLDAVNQQLSQKNPELEARRLDLEILLRHVAAGGISGDARDHITTINHSAEMIFGVEAAEVLGKNIRELFSEQDAPKLAEIMAASRQTSKGLWEKPLHVQRAQTTLTLLVKPTVLRDEQGRVAGMVLVFEDMTELYRAQQAAAWREVARRIAHEVKNPLTPIQLAAQRLWRRYGEKLGEDSQVLRECTQMIVTQVEDLKNLVNEFSRFARLPHLHLTPQDINALIRETLMLYQESEPQITFTLKLAAGLPPVSLDREQVKRVLVNLVDNAIAASQHRGEVSVSTYLHEDGRWLTITVADHGRGIPAQDRERVFEPYFSTKRGGTGLGLAIARAVIEEHQGRIWVEENRPQGSRFLIALPLDRQDEGTLVNDGVANGASSASRA